MITIQGKNGIKATVLAHSISQAGKQLITWEIEYPRLILAELNTHRELSRNSFSSRAVPFMKMLDQLDGEPVRFGANQAGMQDKGEDFDAPVELTVFGSSEELSPKEAWAIAKADAIINAQAFFDAGYHKQVYNRLLEPWQMQKTVLSATQTDNFFWLRDDDAADPTIRELARVMREAKEASTPMLLRSGQWHLPYIDVYVVDGEFHYSINDHQQDLTLEEAIKVSCARCAAVSYRNEGYDLAKSLEVYDRLVGSDRKHASAFEHQATPMNLDKVNNISEYLANDPWESWQKGVSHMDRHGNYWSGNFQGFIQYRKLIPDECYTAPPVV
jgi:thymidylate synthase ThyX